MERSRRAGYDGTGPGAITPDGCAVGVYERMPVGDEPDIIERAVPAGAHILELGCGAGRVTHPLLERGFTVTAVDESPEMLERVRGARTVRPDRDAGPGRALRRPLRVRLPGRALDPDLPVPAADPGGIRTGARRGGPRRGVLPDRWPHLGPGSRRPGGVTRV